MTMTTMMDSLGKAPGRSTLGLQHTRFFVAEVFGEDLHAQRVLSLANGVSGVLRTSILTIHAIGQAYAATAEITSKSAVKQVDRMLSNGGLNLDTLIPKWAAFVIGATESVVIALDWTDFEPDDQTTLAAYMVTSHGRATPLAWQTVRKSELKDKRTQYEQAMIERLQGAIPTSARVTLLADRAFGNQDHYALMDLLGWDYVIRFRGCILVEDAQGEARPAEKWLRAKGQARVLRGARVTSDRAEVGAVVVTKAPRMKEPWCLATSIKDASAAEIVKLYGKRFTIEETFRDTKDLRFGKGLSSTHIRNPQKRDRLLLLVAMAQSLLTLLGAASEASGLDRYLKVNTVKRRTHSLYRQGCYWYSCLSTMREEWFRNLIRAFDQIVREHVFFADVFAIK